MSFRIAILCYYVSVFSVPNEEGKNPKEYLPIFQYFTLFLNIFSDTGKFIIPCYGVQRGWDWFNIIVLLTEIVLLCKYQISEHSLFCHDLKEKLNEVIIIVNRCSNKIVMKFCRKRKMSIMDFLSTLQSSSSQCSPFQGKHRSVQINRACLRESHNALFEFPGTLSEWIFNRAFLGIPV